MSDVRDKNITFDSATPSHFFQEYVAALQVALATIDQNAFNNVFKELCILRERQGQLFVGGNGGCATLANQLCCDWTKGTDRPNKAPLRTHSLSSNMAHITAVANDVAFEQVFSKQLEMLARPQDLLLLMSASGNSPNVLEAARQAQKMEIKTIAFVGFDGGRMTDLADIHIHVAYNNYGVVEDCFQTLMHSMAQLLDCSSSTA